MPKEIITNINLAAFGGRYSIQGEFEGKRYGFWLTSELKPESDQITQTPLDDKAWRFHVRQMSLSKGKGQIVGKVLLEAVPGLLPECLAKVKREEEERVSRVEEAWADHYVKAAAADLLTMAQRCESWLTAVEKAEIEACKRSDHSPFLTNLRAVIEKATGAPA